MALESGKKLSDYNLKARAVCGRRACQAGVAHVL
jgi:hypothetical protein